MKNLYKATLLVALGLATATAAKADSYGDLLVGFTTGTGSDSVYDLGGLASANDNGGTALYNGETWSASTLGISGSGYTWGVIGAVAGGDNTPATAYDTLFTTIASGTPGVIGNQSTWNQAQSGINSIENQLPGGANGFAQGGQFSVGAATANSWDTQTITGPLATDFHNSYGNPNTSGATTVDLYSVNDNGTAPTLDGTFTLSGNGTLTFDTVAVPEPTTYGLIAGAGLLILAVRNKFSRKTA